MLAATTWKDVVLEIVKQTAAIIGAATLLLGAVYRWFFKPIRENQATQIKNQEEMKSQLNGHTKLLRKASRAQGILEGHDKAKRDARHDRKEQLDTAAKVLKVATRATKRGARRSTDK